LFFSQIMLFYIVSQQEFKGNIFYSCRI